MADISSALRSTIPISLFNRGMAGKVFEDVRRQGAKVVMKNNSPESVLLAPEENLRLIDCEMIDTDLAFEYSEVEADIRGGIDSVVNPLSGRIVCDSLGELVSQPAVMECHGEVVIRNNG